MTMLEMIQSFFSLYVNNEYTTDEIKVILVDWFNEDEELLSSLEYKTYFNVSSRELERLNKIWYYIWRNCEDMFDVDEPEAFQLLLENIVSNKKQLEV